MIGHEAGSFGGVGTCVHTSPLGVYWPLGPLVMRQLLNGYLCTAQPTLPVFDAALALTARLL